MKFDKARLWPIVKTVANTLVCAVFLIVGVVASLSLRGDLHLPEWFNVVVGSTLLAFVIGKLLTTVYKAHKE